MWRRWTVVALTVAVSAGLLWQFLRTGSELFYETRALRRATERTEMLKARIAALERDKERLGGDRSYLESVARDELGMVRPRELVYYFPEAIP